jgi:hypothetical protein
MGGGAVELDDQTEVAPEAVDLDGTGPKPEFARSSPARGARPLGQLQEPVLELTAHDRSQKVALEN